MVSSECSMNVGCRRSSRAAANCSVSRIRSSNWRIGSNPASLERGEEESSTSTGREAKKSNDNRGTNCRLILRFGGLFQRLILRFGGSIGEYHPKLLCDRHLWGDFLHTRHLLYSSFQDLLY